ncbi:hypothetical protein SAMN04487904_10177 [Actinopolyspora lacussalsi subsp. righensis]|uniref:Ava_C0101 and related proteins n=1 Tax=Actinopolyspora righensis TaxID=995060 RepID=A0A1I6X410_9ACTN|nr:DUF5996 family protein [Actinopolyspora righensis]SFT32564.1 hypothetical protein SAMN04487904_10177 [Actinopolyspora righensis]
MNGTSTRTERGPHWPELRVEDWSDTRDTLHMWLQLVGKIKLACQPMINHWWQVPLYVSARGLTTDSVPYYDDVFDIEFDFHEHRLLIRRSDGGRREIALTARTVADFYRETMAALDELGIRLTVSRTPNEVVRALPFDTDTEHASYEPDKAWSFWRQLLCAHRVFSDFRSSFIGKVSPVHFFWGAMDLAVTRFSGREAPRHPGGAPNCGDWVMVEGYSHELSSCGFWPGGGAEGAFYAYAYPEPPGFDRYPVGPAAAYFEQGEFLLPYEDVRTASSPERMLAEFLRTTYEAAAECGGWDRRALEDDPKRRASAR